MVRHRRSGESSLGYLHRTAIAMLKIVLIAVGPSSVADSADAPVRLVRIHRAGQVVKAQRSRDGIIHVLLDAPDGPQYVCSHDGGRTFGEPIAILSDAVKKPGLQWHGADLAVGDGYVHVAMANDAWKLKLPQNEWGLFYASLSPGRNSFSQVRNLNRYPSEGFSLAADGQGRVSASFLSGKLYTMVASDHGQHFSAMAEIHRNWDPCDCCTTSSDYGADGRFAVLYREQTGDDRDMYLGLFDPDRGSQPTRTRISATPWHIDACPMTYFAIKSVPGGYLAAWPTQGQVFFARINQDGQVLAPGEIQTPGKTGMRMGLLVIGSFDDTLVAWKNEARLEWQRYDTAGRPIGSLSSTDSPGNWAAGVAVDEGRFILFR